MVRSPFVVPVLLALLASASAGLAQSPDGPVDAAPATSRQERNKKLARGFYEDLWFANRTDRYVDYMADEYVVHDIGDRKNVTEPAIEQKRIADFFHAQGPMTGEIDYQIAEGDLVATRWHAEMQPTSLMFRVLGGSDRLPIINVFRFDDDGKIVEIWNHRHDVDWAWGNLIFAKGLGVGLGVALIIWIVVRLVWRRRVSAT